MLRILTALLLTAAIAATPAFAQDAKPLEMKVTGQIVESDAKDAVRQKPCKVHTVKLEKGKTYIIDMLCTDSSLDPFLRLEDSAGARITEDDDSGGNLNARIRFVPTKDDSYKIICTTFGGGEGNYALVVRDIEGIAKAAAKAGVEKAKAIAPQKDGETKAEDAPKKAAPEKVAAGPKKINSPTNQKPVVEVEGKLQDGDPLDDDKNQLSKAYAIELKAGVAYTIDLKSADFDAFLRVTDEKGKELAADDDSGGDLNSRINFIPKKDGSYRLIATSFNGGAGNFTLAIRQGGDGGKGIKLETPTEKKPTEVAGKLAEGDPIDDARKQISKVYTVDLEPGTIYQIDLTSDDFDSFLRVLDAKGKALAEDDDSGGDLHARVTFAPMAKGSYRIVCTTFDGGDGAFKLKIMPTAKAIPYAAGKAHAVKAPLFITGQLTNKDDKDAVQQNSPCQVTQVKLVKGKTYVIDLISGQMDSFLRVEDAQKKALAEDDDSGGGLNSRLEFTPDEDGTYRLIATNLDGNEGMYILSIREKE